MHAEKLLHKIIGKSCLIKTPAQLTFSDFSSC